MISKQMKTDDIKWIHLGSVSSKKTEMSGKLQNLQGIHTLPEMWDS